MWNDSRFEVGKDFNTKDYFIYDNETDEMICYCDTEEEAKDHVKWMCENEKFYKEAE